MQAVFETIFDTTYLLSVIAAGVILLMRSRENHTVSLFGLMAIILGGGDAFHLIPRMTAFWTSGLEANAAALGTGKFITSITMTVFYLVLYYVWRSLYEIRGARNLTVLIWLLALLRIFLCLFPQNEWQSYDQPLLWGLLRNIPFTILGIILISVFRKETGHGKDLQLKYMPLAITLSFGFYIPVVLFSSLYPLLGMLMIPKTLCYVWVIWMGWKLNSSPEPRQAEA